MGIVYRGIPKKLALNLAIQYKLHNFIETGTYLGRTALWAADHFKAVYTIEILRKFWKDTKDKISKPNIHFCYGDSRYALGIILRSIKSPALIWLDAHWSNDLGYDRPDMGECPVIEELRQINKDGRRHVIMIDDSRLFVDGAPMPHIGDQWPSIIEIERELNSGLFPRETKIIDDVIVSVPV